MKKICVLTLVVIVSSCSMFKNLTPKYREYKGDYFFALSIKNQQLRDDDIYEVLYGIEEEKNFLVKKIKNQEYQILMK